MNEIKEYYSRKDIQKAILKFCKKKEVAFFFKNYFSKRPNTIEYLTDFKNLIQNGVSSFHISEEYWTNPLLLNSQITDKEKDKIREGWDLILDLDGIDFEYSKIVAKIICDYFDELKIKNYSIKFSGNKGFHIGISTKAFHMDLKKNFPQAAKKICVFLLEELEEKIVKKILEKDKSIENIAKKYSILKKELIKEKGKLNFLRLIEIDTILIASRHLYRCPYSINEKSNLVSIPISKNNILNFDKSQAEIKNVNPEKYKEFEFLKYEEKYKDDASILFIKADENINELDNKITKVILNSQIKDLKEKHRGIGSKSYSTELEFTIKEKVMPKEFPKTIKYILKNTFDDGKKRLLFVLLCFFISINYREELIRKIIEKWVNEKENKFKKNYVEAQLKWFFNQKKKISTPNFDNKNYYVDTKIPNEIISSDVNFFKNKIIKNPVHYIYILKKQKK